MDEFRRCSRRRESAGGPRVVRPRHARALEDVAKSQLSGMQKVTTVSTRKEGRDAGALSSVGRAIPVKVAAQRLPVFPFSGFDLYHHFRNDAFYDIYNLLKVRKTGKQEVVFLQPLPQTLYTACSLLVILQNSFGKRHCQKVSIEFHFRIRSYNLI